MSDEATVQRSFYLTDDQAKWIKLQSAIEGISGSALVGNLIDKARTSTAVGHPTNSPAAPISPKPRTARAAFGRKRPRLPDLTTKA